MKAKRSKRFIIFLCVFVLCGTILWGVRQIWFNPYRGTVTAFVPSEELETVLSGQQAVEDFDYLVRRVAERHPACINGLPDKVQIEYERERMRITSSPEVSVLSIWQSTARLLASLGDAHTIAGVNYENAKRLPLSFAWNEDTLICSSGEYTGHSVVQIGGFAVTDLYELFSTQFSYETEAWARHCFATRLNRSEYLAFVGVDTQHDVPLVLEKLSDGSHENVLVTLRNDSITETNETKKLPPVFDFSVDEAISVGVFTLRQCVYDEDYKEGLRSFFTEVKGHNIRSVVVDLRGNPGGNSLVANEFIRYLPVQKYSTVSSEVREGPILWKNKQGERKNRQYDSVFSGNLYVLTAADTFSSALDFAVLISDNNLGTVIGEIPGNMPSSYGDILYFQTPNARLVFTVSYKYFMRPDASKSDLPLIPDVIVPADNALEEALNLIKDMR